MLASLSKSSMKQYSSTYKKWWSFCKGNSAKILQPTTKDILEFLHQEFENGAKYTTLNCHRSAINLISDAGKCDAVERFMKGVFKTRPCFPRYEETWDPHSVLLYVEGLHPLHNLDLEKLSIKLLLLLALCSAHRVQTFCHIRVNNIITHKEGVEIVTSDIIKTSGPKRPQPVLRFPFFRDKPALCAASTILYYLERTKPLRNELEDFLIITIKKPHHRASPQTLSRWIKKG